MKTAAPRTVSSPSRRLHLAGGGLLAILLVLPLFVFLTEEPIQLWDESRNAMNAWEMARNGNLLEVRFEGEPDLWNTKPPLLLWLQAAAYHLVGPSTLAVRLPSVLAAMLTLGALILGLRHLLGRWEPGVLAAVVLVSSAGYVKYSHAARTADFDALLTLFTTGVFLSFCAVLGAPSERSRRWAMLALFGSLTLAVMTKGVAGLLFLPAIQILLTVYRQWGTILRMRATYRGALGGVVVVAALYGAREWATPGYLAAVWQNEIGGRATEVIGDHSGPWYYYLLNLYDRRLFFWIFVLPVGAVGAFFAADPRLRRVLQCALVFVVVHLAVISSVATKLEWYDLAIYPLCAIVTAAGIGFLADLFIQPESAWIRRSFRSPAGARVAFFALIAVQPYLSVLDGIKPREDPAYDASEYLARLEEGSLDRPLKLAREDYHPERWIYVHFARARGLPVELVDPSSLVPGDTVLIVDAGQRERLAARFTLSTVERHKSAEVAVLGARPAAP
ncbi:MAG: ArnT family glycosyltransferase [Verrucomicrobiota bacterium]